MAVTQLKGGAPEFVRVFDQQIALGSRRQLTSRLLESMDTESLTAYFCNVHMLMLAQERPQLATAMDSATYVFPDGVPVAWLQRWLGHPGADVLRGYEAVRAVCAHAAASQRPVGFLGSTSTVLGLLRANLEREYPGLRVQFLAGPTIGDEIASLDLELVERINSNELYCLFVGLGCPKQELWVARYASQLNCSLLAVGAAFDWLAGTTRMPPSWMQDNGLGWLYRLATDPRRTWRRYLKYNSKFLSKSARLVFTSRMNRFGVQENGR